MSNTIAIVGPSGTGKSTSLELLNPKETFIINCAGKPFPFKGSMQVYSEANKNLKAVSKAADVLVMLKYVNDTPSIKKLVVDDSIFIMTDLYFQKAAEVGYGKFTEIAKAYQSMLSYCKSMRDDLDIAIMMHAEDAVSNGIMVQKKVKTVGKLVDDQYDPLSVVSIALFTNVTFDKDMKAQYTFLTNRTVVGGIEIPAKSPRGMFDTLAIPNDLANVFTVSRAYYGS
jgi:adenylate kinase family enzyme